MILLADPANTFKTHRQTFKSLKGRKRLEFVAEYYKLHIAGAIAAIIALVWILNHYWLNPPKQTYFTVAFYNVWIDEEQTNALKGELNAFFLDESDELKDKWECAVDEYVINSGDLQNDYALSQKFTANIMVQSIDVIICGADGLASLREQGLTEYITPLDGSRFLERLGIDGGGLFAVEVVNSKKKEQGSRLINALAL